jgi:ketosteroid isomerase-like protein
VISWLAKRILSYNMAKLRAGDYRPLLRGDAKDVHFRFPGNSSFAADLHGKDALEPWLQRFVALGLQIYPDEVMVKGPPWRSTICVRGTVFLDNQDGRVYDNRYVIWGRMAWGLVREYEVYEDTQKSAELDRYLAAREWPEPPSGSGDVETDR